jgi:hypothetical protein
MKRSRSMRSRRRSVRPVPLRRRASLGNRSGCPVRARPHRAVRAHATASTGNRIVVTRKVSGSSVVRARAPLERPEVTWVGSGEGELAPECRDGSVLGMVSRSRRCNDAT